ncbi:hypothetical protein [Pseudoalteromonas sp.]|uniref:hypothetical protein n=1 Tax=Pseudoalteromonas sp. TaxID=53249 RepID=UPI0035648791
MLKPLIDTFSQLPYQIDYAENHFKNENYHHLSVLTLTEVRDLLCVLRYLQTIGLKNLNSYSRFRNEVEKLLLWLWHQKKQSLANVDTKLLKEYLIFVQCPPESWQTTKIVSRFKQINNVRVYNQQWRPFTYKTNSYESRASIFTVLNHFANYLCEQNVITKNPVKSLRKQDSVLKNTIKPKKKTSIVPKQYISKLLNQWQHDIHRMRDLLLYYFVKNRKLNLNVFTQQMNGLSPLLQHLDLENNTFYYLNGRQLLSIELCQLGWQIAVQYKQLRGNFLQDNAPLLHKQRGSGSFEVRQLRRIITAIDYEISDYEQ